MTTFRRVTLLLALSLAVLTGASLCAAQEPVEAGAQSAVPPRPADAPPPPPHPAGPHHPPRNLKLVDGHWTPYDPPKPGPEEKAYTIVTGDTLWDLSGKFLNSPWLWPQLWDKNRYILDSHWIYPGDPLLLPGQPVVVPPGEIPVAEEEGEVEEEPEVAEQPPAPPQPGPLADKTDLLCSAYIDESYRQPEVKVSAVEEPKRIAYGEGDYVYINRGTVHGVTPGMEFDAIRPVRKIMDPETEAEIGMFITRRGRLKVVAAQATTATAEIVYSCIDVEKGDFLVPKWDPPVPMGFPADPMKRYGVEPSGQAEGKIVASSDMIISMGQGHTVQIDVGEQAGLQPGGRVAIYRPNSFGPEYERYNLGTGLVVLVRPTTSVVKITESVREIMVGDRVELTQ